MPDLKRLYVIADNSVLNAAEDAAVSWDVEGDGSGTFEQGARLSDDGGTSHTHSACNGLESCVDLTKVQEALTNTPLFSVYGCTDRLGNGTVYEYAGGTWTEVGTGDLETQALTDAGLDKYEAEPVI